MFTSLGLGYLIQYNISSSVHLAPFFIIFLYSEIKLPCLQLLHFHHFGHQDYFVVIATENRVASNIDGHWQREGRKILKGETLVEQSCHEEKEEKNGKGRGGPGRREEEVEDTYLAPRRLEKATWERTIYREGYSYE